jgi:mRNA-degrading endonuclease YafQ of YafQ-DinJ toxin-antitoxin module
MYKIQFGNKFLKNVEKFNPAMRELIFKKVAFLEIDPDHPSLRTESLYKGLRSSSVNMDIRIIWEIIGDIINIVNVGKHDIYRQYKNKRRRKSAFRDNQ